MQTLKVVYAGTPEFSQVALKAILKAGCSVPLVLTQPDRPAGRGMKLRLSAVKETALEQGIRILQPTGLSLNGKYKDEAADAQQVLEALRPDVIVVAAYGLILPQWVLDLPRFGCLNIHASLLPRWRGAAPIHRAIEAGDAQTGVCIMQMDAGLDTGDILSQESLCIAPDDTTSSLHDKLADLGAEMIVSVLKRLPEGGLVAHSQPEEGVLYAHKVEKRESLINWQSGAHEIERRMRAFDPSPGVYAHHEGLAIKFWRAEVLPLKKTAEQLVGEIINVSNDGIVVCCADHHLRILELQKPGGRRQAVHEFLQATPLQKGGLFY